MVIAIIVVFHLTVHFRWFGPGLITAGDWWNVNQRGLAAFFPYPSLFDLSSNLGADNATALNYFPILALVGALGHIGIPYAMIERLVNVFPVTIVTPVAGYVLARQFTGDLRACAVAAIFFASNTYISVVTSGGQLTIAMAYGLSAAFAAMAIRVVVWRESRDALICALLLACATAFDVRMALLSVVWVALIFPWIVRIKGSPIRFAIDALRVTGIFGIAFIMLTLYISVPLLGARGVPHPPGNFGESFWITVLSYMSFWQALGMDHPFWYDNAIHKFRWIAIVPIAGALYGIYAAVATKQRSIAIGLGSALLIGALACAGSRVWTGALYIWLFEHFRPMSLFRDPSKFFEVIALSYVGLIALAIAHLFARLPVKSLWSIVVTVVAFTIVSWPSAWIVAGLDRGVFVTAAASEVERTFASILERDRSSSRVVWAPAPDRFVPGDYLHPQVDSILLASLERNQRPFGFDASVTMRTLHDLGIGYIAIRLDDGGALGLPANFEAFRTLRLYETLGAFGKAILETPSLHVYRIGNTMAALVNKNPPHFSIDSAPHSTERIDANYCADLKPIAISHGDLVSSNCRMKIPPIIRMKNVIGTVHSRSSVPGTLLGGGKSVRIQAILSHDTPYIPTTIRGNSSIDFTIPDWTEYVDVAVDPVVKPPNIFGPCEIVIVDPYIQRGATGRCVAGSHALIYVQAMRSVTLQVHAGRVRSMLPVSSTLSGLISRENVGLFRRSADVTLDLPYTAFQPMDSTEHEPSLALHVDLNPLTLKIGQKLPAGMVATIPVASSAWIVRGGSSSEKQPRILNDPREAIVRVAIASEHEGIALNYLPDHIASIGAVLSLVALVTVLTLIALSTILEWRLSR